MVPNEKEVVLHPLYGDTPARAPGLAAPKIGKSSSFSGLPLRLELSVRKAIFGSIVQRGYGLGPQSKVRVRLDGPSLSR